MACAVIFLLFSTLNVIVSTFGNEWNVAMQYKETLPLDNVTALKITATFK